MQWLGEQHGKGLLDQLFGQVGSKQNGWIAQYIRKKTIFSCDDVLAALKEGAARSQTVRPDGPKWVCKKVDFPEHHQMQTKYLYAASLKITRTYSLLAEPHPLPHFPPKVYDCLFADSDARRLITDFRVETCDWPEAVPWRKTFYSGDKDWEEGAPDPQQTHHLKKLWEAQRHCRPPRQMFHTRSFEERVQRAQKSHAKKGAALEKRLKVLKQLAGHSESLDPVAVPAALVEEGEEESSSSSSSSSSSEED